MVQATLIAPKKGNYRNGTKRPASHALVELDAIAGDLREQVDSRLAELVPAAHEPPEILHQSMRYSLLAPGKRIRPVVAMLVAHHFGGRTREALDPACAIEMVHAASLILDDLPSMDDAMMRRGQPANHVRFGEDTAQLAAVALLNQSFAVISRADRLTPSVRIELVEVLSGAIGSAGLIAGQTRDLNQALRRASTAELEETNMLKTGTLFVASAEIGARVAGIPENKVVAVRRFAHYLGLAFQVLDDILDATATIESAGKDVCQDTNKTTLVSTLGIENSRHMANRFIDTSVAALRGLAFPGDPLSALAISLRLKM